MMNETLHHTKAQTIAQTIIGLRDLGVRLSDETLHSLLTQATTQRLDPIAAIEQLVAMERRERDARNLARRTRVAKLGTVTPADEFDWSHPRKLDRHLIERLFTMDFVQNAQNVLFRGPSGVGKTTLAKLLGFEALRRGYNVRFCTFANALADLLKQESLPALERRLKLYTAPELLILDELGYLPCDNQAADILFSIVSRRHEHRSLIITTNLPFKQWPPLFSGAACVAALVDRFAQHCHTVDIEADSWRQKHSLNKSRPHPKPQTPMDNPS